MAAIAIAAMGPITAPAIHALDWVECATVEGAVVEVAVAGAIDGPVQAGVAAAEAPVLAELSRDWLWDWLNEGDAVEVNGPR
jgi:hypothetical protein